MTYKGLFKPQHPERYLGDPKNIIYRSGWELKLFFWLDSHPSVKNWASEEKAILYVDPTNNRTRRYFPDVLVHLVNGRTFICEVKPAKQTTPPKTKNKKRLLKESLVYARNLAKWQSAERWCKQRGYEFKILTEKELGIR